MARGFYNYPTKPAFVIPCACGSREAYWHGPEDGARVYCCDRCWESDRSNPRLERKDGKR